MTTDSRIPTMPGRSTSVFTNQADVARSKREGGERGGGGASQS